MKNFATCLNCIDGRAQLPVINWIIETHGYDYVDLITEPGIIKLLAENEKITPDFLDKIQISIEKHNSDHLFLVAHYDCAGNPVSDHIQKKQIYMAVDKLKDKVRGVTITGLWVNDDWRVEEVVHSNS